MANHKDAAKRAVQALKRRARNRSNRTRMRNEIADLRAAIGENQGKEKIQAALSEAVSVIQRLAAKGIIHRNQAVRRVKRLHSAAKKAA